LTWRSIEGDRQNSRASNRMSSRMNSGTEGITKGKPKVGFPFDDNFRDTNLKKVNTFSDQLVVRF
jgi:hypothetical protein